MVAPSPGVSAVRGRGSEPFQQLLEALAAPQAGQVRIALESPPLLEPRVDRLSEALHCRIRVTFQAIGARHVVESLGAPFRRAHGMTRRIYGFVPIAHLMEEFAEAVPYESVRGVPFKEGVIGPGGFRVVLRVRVELGLLQ